MTRQRFLDELRALPAGLSGRITVRDLRVQPFAGFAVGKRADEAAQVTRAVVWPSHATASLYPREV